MRQPDKAFWPGKKVLITGHTGFKGAWATLMLEALGAELYGLALPAEQGPNAYEILAIEGRLMGEALLDIRDEAGVDAVINGFAPDLVLHMAAEAIVARSYQDPVGTFETNVNGTLHILSALRGSATQAIVVVTTDKVYRNEGQGVAFKESDALGGHDPYSASKAACDIAVESFRSSFADLPPTATARAGNVVGGGDFGPMRLIPDMVRAKMSGEPLVIRHPQSTRPFQHVLDVLRGYLFLLEDLAKGHAPQAVNFGPSQSLCVLEVLKEAEKYGFAQDWLQQEGQNFGEAKALALDTSLAQTQLNWQPALKGEAIFSETFQWYKEFLEKKNMAELSQDLLRKAIS